jgi:triosephosphate isomerase
MTGPGAYTGETSAELIKSLGVRWTLVGHSERRARGESSDEEGVKAAYALQSGLNVIACIGEQLGEREGGQTMQVLAEQMQAYVDQVSGELGSDPAVWADRFVIAYEPVWAIGTGVVASPEQAQDTHVELRAWIAKTVSPQVAEAVRIIYGGSVSAKVCDSLADKPDVDGFLVGGASLKAEEFGRICQAAARKAL